MTSFPQAAYSFAKQTTAPSYTEGHDQKECSLCFSSGKSHSGRRCNNLFITCSPFFSLGHSVLGPHKWMGRSSSWDVYKNNVLQSKRCLSTDKHIPRAVTFSVVLIFRKFKLLTFPFFPVVGNNDGTRTQFNEYCLYDLLYITILQHIRAHDISSS